jgi:hypothetical protein
MMTDFLTGEDDALPDGTAAVHFRRFYGHGSAYAVLRTLFYGKLSAFRDAIRGNLTGNRVALLAWFRTTRR